jgi:hypothetical protein
MMRRFFAWVLWANIAAIIGRPVPTKTEHPSASVWAPAQAMSSV